MKTDLKNLLDLAVQVMKNAYCPYSHFSVGSAVVGGSGKTYSGCNVENASYGASICAERSAILQAVAHGEKTVTQVALVTSGDRPCVPCGMCLQVMTEFGSPDLQIISSTVDKSKMEKFTLRDFLPKAFSKSYLKS